MASSRWALVLLLAAYAAPLHATQAAAAPQTAAQNNAPPTQQIKSPAAVFIIRHAEKPVGDDKSPDLNPVGFTRARAVPSLFIPSPGHFARFPRPDFLFASAPAKHSNRPVETITPLAQALHMKINTDYADIETVPIARRILSGAYAGKVVLICWHHGEIPHLAEAFGVADAPHRWDPDVLDQIWEIQWIDGKPSMVILPQRLLPGDATQ